VENPSNFKRPKASTIGTPVYHRRRRDWKDDRDLLEELASQVNRVDGPYDSFDVGVTAYREKVKSFEKSYETNKEAFFMAMWVREQLSELSRKQGNYHLSVHALTFPEDLDRTIHGVEKRATQSGFVPPQQETSLSVLFPEPELRNYARERMQMLHRGDLNSYLASLVSKERDSLATNSASIMDLIHICEHKLNLRQISFEKRYVVGETDLWITAWSLGIEVKNTWGEQEELSLISTLSNTNFRLRARHLVVVVPDSLSDDAFEMIRAIERRDDFSNLSILRIGDLGTYLDKIKEIEDGIV
tara:strand:- start:13261 stop:14163 length:903 start_codon:yes stop_codon:yes gene_type:complete